jgi:hypothetical protein
MKIKVKTKEYSDKLKKVVDKNVMCDVAKFECKNYDCLHVGKWRHQNKSIDGAQSSYYDNFYSCLHRNYHGCPGEPKLKAK